MGELRTRKPTGRPSWPLVLVEGEEKAGKSYALAQLSASPLVDRCFVWDLGDGTMDEYGPLGDYEIVETNGTYTSLYESVKAATAIEPAEGKCNVYGIDSGTDLWELLSRWAHERAKTSKAGIKKLQDDPDAEIDPGHNLWNDSKDRWSSVINMLRRAPGIGVVTAVGGEVTAFEGGKPTTKKTWSVQAEKTIPRAANAWVRVQRDPRKATLVGVRRLGLEVPKGGLVLPLENTLHHLVFEIIGAGGAEFSTSTTPPAQLGMTVATAKNRLVDALKALNLSAAEAKAEAKRRWDGVEAFVGLTANDEVPLEAVTALLTNVATDTGPDEDTSDTGGDAGNTTTAPAQEVTMTYHDDNGGDE